MMRPRPPRRSLTGAWIETEWVANITSCPDRRSLTGAWIETVVRHPPYIGIVVAPLRGRGLKPSYCLCTSILPAVAPLRGRGLKRVSAWILLVSAMSLPYGGVD